MRRSAVVSPGPAKSATSTLFEGLSRQTITQLTESAAYTDLIGSGATVFKVVPVESPSKSTLPDLVVFFIAVNENKGGTPIPEFSPTGVSLFRYEEQGYENVWMTTTEIEPPDFSRPIDDTPWMQDRFEVIDVTGDRNAAVFMSGCGGFGNRCVYFAYVWSLAGDVLFQYRNSRWAGVQLLRPANRLVTRSGENIVGDGMANRVPTQWRLDCYRWTGSTFSKFSSRIVPFQDYTGPAVESCCLPTATPIP